MWEDWMQWRHPAQVVVVGFVLATVVGTALLMLPVATEGDRGAELVPVPRRSTSTGRGGSRWPRAA
jgi:hypothetical protein